IGETCIKASFGLLYPRHEREAFVRQLSSLFCHNLGNTGRQLWPQFAKRLETMLTEVRWYQLQAAVGLYTARSANGGAGPASK
ncbi:MAG: hypothetical protein ACPHYG_02125, partial [Flavobacteriales bacterium]